MNLKWNDDGDRVWANSVLHDDGSPFNYTFERARKGWSNETDAELCPPDAPCGFDSLEDAKAWAERVEAGVIEIAA